MCIIKVSIMDYSKYTSKQIEILERVFSAMCIQAHTFSLMARFNIDRIYGEPMNIIEQRYQEKLDFCEYIFISSEDHSISNYLQTPSLIFGFDYKNDGFFEISKFMDRINNKKSKPSNDELIFTAAVMNGYADFINKNKNQLNNTVKNILKKYV